MNIERFKTIDLGKLLKIDLRQLTWLPCIMILTVVINTSLNINELELQALSYMVLALVLLSFVIMSFLYLKKRYITWFTFIIIAFQFLLLTSTLINGNDIKRAIYQGCSVIFIVMVCDHFKNRFHLVIGGFAIAFSICAYLNFLHLITHPELWIVDNLKSSQGYLLGGNYNQMGCRLICAVGTSVVCLKYSKWWILNVIPVILVSVVTLGIVGSMTSLTGIMLFLIFCLIPSRKLLKIGIASLIGFVIFFQITVCFQGKGIEKNPLAVYFIEDVLGKDITFTNRTYLWDAAAKVVIESPIYGYGIVDGDWYYSHMSTYAKGPHNFIWELLVFGGILLLAFFSYICFKAFLKLPSTDDRHILLIYAVIAVLFLMMTMEAYPLPFIFCLLSLAFFAPRSPSLNLIEENNDNESMKPIMQTTT